MKGFLALAVVAATLALAAPASADFWDTPAKTWGTNGRVNTILPVGDRVYVGGTFSALIDPSGVSYPVSNLAVFNAATGAPDLNFQAKTNGAVIALATDDARLYIGGAFDVVSDAAATWTRGRIAALDRSTGEVQAWAPKATGSQVDAVAFSAATGSVYMGGNFTTVTGAGGSAAPNPFIAKIDAASAEVDQGFQAAPSDRVRALNVAADGSGRLFVGGDFLNVSGATKTKSLAAVRLTTGVLDSSFVPGPTNEVASPPVLDITSDPARVFVATTGSGGSCAALNGTTGGLLWSAHANGNMQAVRLVGQALYCGGHFGGTGSFEGVTREKLAAVDADTGSVLPFKPRVNTALGTWSLGAQVGDPNLYMGGDFTKVSGLAQPRFAQFIDSSLRGAPQPPSRLSGQPGHRVAYLSWSVPSSDGGASVSSYKVYRGLSPSGDKLASLLATVSGSTPSYEDTTPENGTTYYYEVVAINKLGASTASNEVAVTPDPGVKLYPPGPPTSVTASNPPGSVHLTWNPPVDDGGAPVNSYTIYRGTTPGGQAETPIATGVTGTSFDDVLNIVAGTTYFYVVTASNVVGEGSPSAEVSAVVEAGVPGRPILSGTLSDGIVTLSWSEPPDGGSPILKYVLLRNAVKLAGNIPPSQTTFDTPVISGETNVYQVKAVNAIGSGPLSNKVTITVP